MDPSTDMVPLSPTGDEASESDAENDRDGKISEAEQGDDNQEIFPFGENQPEKSETSSSILVARFHRRELQFKSLSETAVPAPLVADGVADSRTSAGSPTPATGGVDNTDSETTSATGSSLDERSASGKQEVLSLFTNLSGCSCACYIWNLGALGELRRLLRMW